jgi:hypothetical protein
MQKAIADHPKPNVATLAIVLADVLTLDSEDVGKRPTGIFEGDAVAGEVRRCFGVIPLEVIVAHSRYYGLAV